LKDSRDRLVVAITHRFEHSVEELLHRLRVGTRVLVQGRSGRWTGRPGRSDQSRQLWSRTAARLRGDAAAGRLRDRAAAA
jgi:hypothetical protein